MNYYLYNILFPFVISFSLTYLFSMYLLKKGKHYTSKDKPELVNFHATKENIPNVGGIAFISSALITTLFFIGINSQIIYMIFFISSYAILGFIDDNSKRFSSNGDGIKTKTKLFWQFIIATFFVVIGTSRGYISTGLSLFTKEGTFYQIFENCLIIFFFAYFTNAFNITDGIDGLLGTISLPMSLLLIIIALNSKLNQIPIVLGVCIFASVLAFLHFNRYPAKYFMGDCGSMALGATLFLLSLTLKQSFIFIIVSLMVSLELVSSFLQIVAINVFHKRVFSIAPLHHLYEKNGNTEIEIVRIFSKLSALFSIIALLIYLY